MSDEIRSQKLSRRGFLKSAAVAGGVAAAGAVAPQVQAGVVAQPRADENQPTPPKGYHETPHILEYYEKARF
ncbi:MAG: twin-arginine translocation signal domain-containing protein [Arenicellales bacterium]